MNYFASLPNKLYDIEKNKKYRVVTDLNKRVGIRSDMSSILSSYFKSSLSTSQRPELVSNSMYGDVMYHWILMQVNGVIDPYYDWVMEDATFDDFLIKKYPNKSLLLETDHFITSGVDANGYNSDPNKTFFHIGETISGSISSATGTVIEFDPTVKQVLYKSLTGTFESTDIISGSISTALGKVESATIELDAVHHYESSAPQESDLIVSRDYVTIYGTTYYYSTAVSNYEYELLRNESNREILVLNSGYVQQYVSEFKGKIKN